MLIVFSDVFVFGDLSQLWIYSFPKSYNDEVSRFKNGEEKLMGFFIGQINKETKGKISHKIIIDELKKKLNN